MQSILDACAIIAYLRDEVGADVVETALNNDECIVHALNLCEVYKDCLVRGDDKRIADQLLLDLQSIGLYSCEEMDEKLWKNAALLKSKHKMSLADCFALSLASRRNGKLLTSDHHELDSVVDKGICEIEFIR
jgi:PIN domain nuclease of toxin-antitoxin system